METIARPYARAAFAIAREAREVEKWSEFLNKLAQYVLVNHCIEVLKNPIVKHNEKMSLLFSIFDSQEELNTEQKNFLSLLLINDRANFLPVIQEIFMQMKQLIENTIDINVTTAYKLDSDEEFKIAEKLGKMTGRKANIIQQLDTSLIGGLIIEWDGKTLDCSIKGKLEKLRANL